MPKKCKTIKKMYFYPKIWTFYLKQLVGKDTPGATRDLKPVSHENLIKYF